MASQSATFFQLSQSLPASRLFSPLLFSPPKLQTGIFSFGTKGKAANVALRTRCAAISKPQTEGRTDILQDDVPIIKLNNITKSDVVEEIQQVAVANEISRYIETIRSMLVSMEDGEISVSPYDTAWVALVKDIHGSEKPQFPTSLQWIIDHQFEDGSWGDTIFTAHDRILNTLACVVALKFWNVQPQQQEKGMKYVRENLYRLGDENAEHMPIGFEVAFPSLIELAKTLDIEIPEDDPILQEIYASRNLKLTKIPKEILHKVPTTLLHSLEGMPGIDWEKLLKLQCQDGSFLFSPSSTAYALAQTKDEKCLNYLQKAVEKFNGGVPNVYPVDMFEHIWAIDRLQRLGISRYFESEFKDLVEYIARYWTDEGICWARNTHVQDVDDTAMAFRILRLHGHEVSPHALTHFEKDGGFICFQGQSTQAVTGMYNLFRASQVMFPGEEVLQRGRDFAEKYLREKQAQNELFDKWIIMKDLPGEVGYALDIPWFANLPRVESRFYIEQYGGEDDVWIGKTLYRMPYVNNNTYLELAKLDYNNCQALHQHEWDNFQKWYTEFKVGQFGVSKRALLCAYFLAAANIYEPERSSERLAWAKTMVLLEAVSSYFNNEHTFADQRSAFVDEFRSCTSSQQFVNYGRRLDSKKSGHELVGTVLGTLNHLSVDALMAHGADIRQDLHHAWENWLLSWHKEGDKLEGAAELLVKTINLSGGRWLSDELLSHPQYKSLSQLTNRVCHELGCLQKNKISGNNICDTSHGRIENAEIESDMQELTKQVLQNSSHGIDPKIKQTFLTVARSAYYVAFCDPRTINFHIAKVLFERV
ncbi:Terpene synthase, metal-binding domain [Dillenia turbinata]|uniref:Terpene synthase, metal-binding domain n=1 Tax=Dillenia turbinata TaxID=194707 RepID=A0AAN8VWS5_9MAGN